jgi:hypothetical protein
MLLAWCLAIASLLPLYLGAIHALMTWESFQAGLEDPEKDPRDTFDLGVMAALGFLSATYLFYWAYLGCKFHEKRDAIRAFKAERDAGDLEANPRVSATAIGNPAEPATKEGAPGQQAMAGAEAISAG